MPCKQAQDLVKVSCVPLISRRDAQNLRKSSIHTSSVLLFCQFLGSLPKTDLTKKNKKKPTGRPNAKNKSERKTNVTLITQVINALK